MRSQVPCACVAALFAALIVLPGCSCNKTPDNAGSTGQAVERPGVAVVKPVPEVQPAPNIPDPADPVKLTEVAVIPTPGVAAQSPEDIDPSRIDMTSADSLFELSSNIQRYDTQEFPDQQGKVHPVWTLSPGAASFEVPNFSGPPTGWFSGALDSDAQYSDFCVSASVTTDSNRGSILFGASTLDAPVYFVDPSIKDPSFGVIAVTSPLNVKDLGAHHALSIPKEVDRRTLRSALADKKSYSILLYVHGRKIAFYVEGRLLNEVVIPPEGRRPEGRIGVSGWLHNDSDDQFSRFNIFDIKIRRL